MDEKLRPLDNITNVVVPIVNCVLEKFIFLKPVRVRRYSICPGKWPEELLELIAE